MLCFRDVGFSASWRKLLGGAALAGALAGPALADNATTPTTQPTTQQQQQQIQQLNQAGTAGAQASGLTEGPIVSYQQVLQNPDDPGLNAAYARGLIRQGNVLGAAATLERILLTHPDLPELRLLYALVLYRLGDLTSAQREVNAVNPSTLPPSLVAERARLLNLINNSLKRMSQTVSVALGGEFDTDRNSAPQSGEVLIVDIPFTLQGNAEASKDYGEIAQLGYTFDYDLGTDPKQSLYGVLNVLSNRQSTVSVMNTNYEGIEAGIKTKVDSNDIQIGAVEDMTTLSAQPYMHEYGVVVRPTRQINDQFDVYGDLRATYQGFWDSSIDTTANEFDGLDPTAWLGVGWKPPMLPDHRFTAAVGYEQRFAADAFDGYRHPGLRIGDTWLFSNGMFLAPQAEFGNWQYNEPNPIISAENRTDHTMRLDLTYGVPLGTIAGYLHGKLPDQLSSVVVTVSGEYFDQVSTLPNYTYTNMKATALISKRWEF